MKAVVAVRCRPVRTSESRSDVCVEVDEEKILVLGERQFCFNNVFGEEVKQSKVYKDVVLPVVDKFLLGFNVSVMAYGQTGTGKTYTMGTDPKVSDDHRGITYRVLQDVFKNKMGEISVRFFEIYQEDIYDLLSSEPKKKSILDIQQSNFTSVTVKDVEEAQRTMLMGFRNRRVGATSGNSSSSRSHAVFTICHTAALAEGVSSSLFNLVDLAGSENVTDMTGDRRREGLMINQGLLQLGNVMSALCKREEYIPYRNSVLTRVLKDSLTLHNYIILIACVSPLRCDASETVSTLEFAKKVSTIKSQPEAVRTRTPFKAPLRPFSTHNNTIATPGRLKCQRYPLVPLNNTVDSPRNGGNWTPFSRKMMPHMTSTPAIMMPPPPPRPPVPERTKAHKRRSSTDSEWSALDISSSTTVDGACVESAVQKQVEDTFGHGSAAGSSTSVITGVSEDWLRTVIQQTVRDVMRNELAESMDGRRPSCRSLFSAEDEDRPSPAKLARHHTVALENSEESSCSSFNTLEGTVLITPIQRSPKMDVSGKLVSHPPVRRSARLSVVPAESSSKQPLRRSVRLPVVHAESSSKQPLRRSVRLSVVQAESSKQLLRRSVRLSLTSTPVDLGVRNQGPELVRQSASSTRLSPLANAKSSKSVAETQRDHNDMILHLLQNGNAKQLQSLPTIGPKTATIICNHRLLFGPLESLQELKNVRGLTAGFPKRFFWANNIPIED